MVAELLILFALCAAIYFVLCIVSGLFLSKQGRERQWERKRKERPARDPNRK